MLLLAANSVTSYKTRAANQFQQLKNELDNAREVLDSGGLELDAAYASGDPNPPLLFSRTRADRAALADRAAENYEKALDSLLNFVRDHIEDVIIKFVPPEQSILEEIEGVATGRTIQ